RAHRPEQVGEQRPHPHVLAGPPAGQGEVAAVAVDVLPEQRDFGDALGGEGPHLVDDVVEGTADLAAPHRGDDAEGAVVVAADLDGDPGGVRDLAPGGQRGGERLVVVGDGLLEDLDDRAAGGPLLGHQLGGPPDVVGAEHDVDL